MLDLRTKTDSLSSQLSAAQRTILDQSNRLDQLNQQVATLARPERGHGQPARPRCKSSRRTTTPTSTRALKKFEPQQQTVDGVPGDGAAGRNGVVQRGFDSSSATATSRTRRRRSSFIAKYPAQPVSADRAVLARQRAVRAARLQGIDGDLAGSGEELSARIRGRRKRCSQSRTIRSSKVRRPRRRRRWSRSSRSTAARKSRSRRRARCRR